MMPDFEKNSNHLKIPRFRLREEELYFQLHLTLNLPANVGFKRCQVEEDLAPQRVWGVMVGPPCPYWFSLKTITGSKVHKFCYS